MSDHEICDDIIAELKAKNEALEAENAKLYDNVLGQMKRGNALFVENETLREALKKALTNKPNEIG